MSDEKYPLLETARDEESMYFSSGVQDQACVGYLRGDFGNGTRFYTTWWDHHEELKDQEFKDELDDVVNSLRKDGPLKDFSSMQRFCWSHSQTRMSPQAGTEYYGFRVDTDKHRYYLRLCPMKGNYNFYIYCYKTDLLEKTIKTLVVEPMQPCRVQEIPDTLEAMQKIVSGDIEAVYPSSDSVIVDMLLDFQGFARILTILARGYLFDGGDLDIARARRALCAWCSVPNDSKTAGPKKDWQFDTEFSAFYAEFPELVETDGVGWLVRHVRRMCAFAEEHPDVVSKPDASACGKLAKGFEREWRKKVVQLQVPIFAPNTQAAWGLRFDDVLADALELGPLRSLDVSFSPALEQRIEEATPKGVPTEVLWTLIGYYLSNRQEDTDWVVLPVVSFDAYFGKNFSHKWLNALPADLIVRGRDKGRGVCRYRVVW